MWVTFGLAMLLAAAVLYLPGMIALAPLRLQDARTLIFAPCASLFFYVVLVFAFSASGVFATGTLVLGGAGLISVLLCAIGFIVRRLIASKASVETGQDKKVPFGSVSAWLCAQRYLFLYVGVGAVLTLVVFVRNLDGPDSFVQFSDNIFHMSLIHSYVESGNWSPLAATVFPENAWSISASFYPSLFHILGAILVSMLGVSAALAENALLTVIIALVIPLSMLQFVRTVFPDRLELQFYGAFTALGFAAFPWMFLVFGPLYSNLLSFAIVPLGLSAFIMATKPEQCRSERATWLGIFLVAIISMVVAQTNACFTVGVILIPYCLTRIWEMGEKAATRAKRIIPVAVFSLAVIILWCVCYNLPFLRGVVGHTWPAFSGLAQAPINILFLAYKDSSAQIFLGVVLLIGIFYLCRAKRARWLVWGYGIFMVMYLICALTDGPLKQFLAGFWYTDGYRIAASAVICAIPIAAAGLCRLVRFLQYLLNSFAKSNGEGWSSRYVGAGIVLGLLVLLNYYPNYIMPGGEEEVRTGIGEVASLIGEANAQREPYSVEEQDFVNEVHEIVGDEPVMNFPFDGSALSFAEGGLNVLYRQLDAGDLTVNKTIREELDRVAEDEDVQAQLDSLGVRYLIVLDQGKKAGKGYFGYDPVEWVGVEAITDETPGLKVLLSEGDMRLYEIE